MSNFVLQLSLFQRNLVYGPTFFDGESKGR